MVAASLSAAAPVRRDASAPPTFAPMPVGAPMEQPTRPLVAPAGQPGGVSVGVQPPVQVAGGAAPRLPGAGQKRKAKAKARPAQPQVVNQSAPPVVAPPVVAVVTPAAVDEVVQVEADVMPLANSAAVPAGKKVKVWCWKCASKTHAVRDCTARHYC